MPKNEQTASGGATNRASRAAAVPKSLRARYDAIVAATDLFCAQHLDAEYADLARRAVTALCRKRPSPLTTGGVEGWACGVLYALGRVNFLSDPSFAPHMTMQELCERFGVSSSTGAAKAKHVRAALNMRVWDGRWGLRSLVEDNPLVWMVQVNGFLVDIRDLPLDVQELAHERGIIPHVPGERNLIPPIKRGEALKPTPIKAAPLDELPLFAPAGRPGKVQQ